jgi:zinc protease
MDSPERSIYASRMSRLVQPEQRVLSNGLPVILQHHDGLVAASYWWVRVGSADEAPHEAGYAHFLEHMLFKDAAAKETGRASTGRMARAIESLGGEVNAYTSFDQTVYHVTCAAHHWERVIDAWAPLAAPQRFLRSDFEREREVILEELRKNQDSPGRQLFETLFGATYRSHPYGRPVIGRVKTLKAATVASLEAFYRRNYVSGKMGLVLVGPLDDSRRKGIVSRLERYFGARVIPKRAGERRPRPVEPALRPEARMRTRGFDVKTPTLALAFRAPELRHPDIPALDLATSILSMGELSRLYQKLFYGLSVATDSSGGLYVPHDPGMAYFQAEVDDVAKVMPAGEALIDELARLREEGPTPEELQRVIVNAESERLYATQTADGTAARLGFLRFIVGDLNFDRDYLEELRAVDARRLREVASRYFDHRRMSGVALVPEASAGLDLSGLARRAEERLRSVEAAKPATKAGRRRTGSEPRFLELPSGLRAIFRESPGSKVFSAHAVALGGLRLELTGPVESPEADWGSSYMMSLTWAKGTSSRSAKQIAALVEGSAASLDGFSGRNTVGLQLTGLSRDWLKLSGLFEEVLAQPSFPEDEVEHSRRVAEDAVRGVEDHSSQLCSKLFLETLFEKHPYGHLTTGSLESLPRIGGAKLRAFHRKWVRPERLVVSVSGDVRHGDWETWIRELDARLATSGGPGGQGEAGATEEGPLRGPRWAERRLGREQTHILVGGLGIRVTDDERHALRLLQTLLGGQSGRLFVELRERKSLAYTVAPVSFEGIEPGYVGTYIACAPTKREEALAGIRNVIEGLAKKGPTAAEMSRAKEYYLGRRAMELQSDSALAGHYGLEAVYGLPYRSDGEVVRRIRSIAPREVRAVCARYLAEPPMVTSVVG